MNVYSQKDMCSGCTACMNICPVDAITMIADSEGFEYPHIDETKCTECGLCQKICPFQPGQATQDDFRRPLSIFAAKHQNNDIRLASSSGGMFTALSDYILDKRGVVYGAAFDKEFRVCHQKAENKTDRDKFRGSKYVQSHLGDIFQDAKAELNRGREVLFGGTPCQIAGLRAFLGDKKYGGLILCDLVCHGTPSPLIWKEYVSLLEKRMRCNLQSFKFRDKGDGWHTSRLYAEFVNGACLYHMPLVDSFNSIFYQHIALRPSCHNCIFTNFARPSDITIADFWGIEKCKPDFDDNQGVSLVLLNTPKGEAIFDKIKGHLDYVASSIEECRQRHLTEPAEPSPKRAVFWNDYYEYGFEYVAKKYTDYGFVNGLKHNVIKPMLSKIGVLNAVESIIQRQ